MPFSRLTFKGYCYGNKNMLNIFGKYIYNSYLFWSNYKCRALVTRKQKNKLKLNIKLNNAYFKLQLFE